MGNRKEEMEGVTWRAKVMWTQVQRKPGSRRGVRQGAGVLCMKMRGWKKKTGAW